MSGPGLGLVGVGDGEPGGHMRTLPSGFFGMIGATQELLLSYGAGGSSSRRILTSKIISLLRP